MDENEKVMKNQEETAQVQESVEILLAEVYKRA